MRYLIQLLVPVFDNDGQPFARELFAATRRELMDRFGGLTAYERAPAKGFWQEEDGAVVRDDVLMFEVMTDAIEREWWAGYRRTLEKRFRQDEIVARAIRVERL